MVTKSKSIVLKTLYLRYSAGDKSKGIPRRGDALLYLLGDSDGERELMITKEPLYQFYVSNEELEYHQLSRPIETLTPHVVKYSRRHYEMAQLVGLGDEYKLAKMDWTTKNDWIKRNLYGNPMLYNADVDIEDSFKMAYKRTNGNNVTDVKPSMGFSDIEVRADMGPFEQHAAVVPISSLCHLDAKSKTIYAIIVRDPNIPDMIEVENNLKDFVVNELRPHLEAVRVASIEKIRSIDGNVDMVPEFDFKFEFIFVDSEEDAIVGYFDVIKMTAPDFCAIWNINFDMIFIKNRARKLGLSMSDLVSDPRIPPEYRSFVYHEDQERFDTKSATHYSRYFDQIYTTGSTQFYDHMSMHSNLRKRFQEENYKLDTMGEKYAFINKVDLASLGLHIKTVITENFRVFLKYAIQDVIVPWLIEYYNDDIAKYMLSCQDSRFSQGIRKTTLIKNDMSNFLRDNMNHIIGNNKPYDIREKIPGAIIAKPTNIVKKGITVLGIETHIYKNSVDLDLAAEYPNIMISYNILKTTSHGRIVDIYIPREMDGLDFKQTVSNGTEFNQMLETLDTSILDIGVKYFGLPAFEDVIDLIENASDKMIFHD